MRATTEPLLDGARELLRGYAHGRPVDLCFQNFDAELAAPLGAYAAPTGYLPRLCVRQTFRRSGFGRLLARTLLAAPATRRCCWKHWTT